MAGLLSLVEETVNEFKRVKDLQQLLKISTELKPEEINFLVSAYLQLSEPHLEQCFVTLGRIQKTLDEDWLFDE